MLIPGVSFIWLIYLVSMTDLEVKNKLKALETKQSWEFATMQNFLKIACLFLKPRFPKMKPLLLGIRILSAFLTGSGTWSFSSSSSILSSGETSPSKFRASQVARWHSHLRDRRSTVFKSALPSRKRSFRSCSPRLVFINESVIMWIMQCRTSLCEHR